MNWTFTDDKDWSTLRQRFDWVAAMDDVPQDPIHHAEGNVAIHTQMVLAALQQLAPYQDLDESGQTLLCTAALLHDVEKRSTTVQEDDGRITSHGHARKGALTARQILYQEVPAPFAIREQIVNLVRYHGLPLWAMEKPDPAKAVIGASLHTPMQLLATLAEADARGRICADQQDLLDRIGLFKLFCEEQQCWQAPRSFVTDLARFVYFQKEDTMPDYVPYDDLKGDVIMLAGLPGMGKDTYLQKHHPDLPVVSLDDIRRQHGLKPTDTSATGWAVQEAREQARTFLRKGAPFVWNATNITRSMRKQWIDLFVSYKARVKVIYLEVPYKTWLQQNKNRTHPVPEKVLRKMLSKLEVPTLQEAHTVQYEVTTV